jgi:TolA-binding protein
MYKHFLLLPAILISIFSCSTERIDMLEKSNRSLRSDITEIRGLLADQAAEISRTRADLRLLSGKTEEIQHAAIGRTKELETNLSQLQARIPPPPGVPEELLSRTEDQLVGISGDAADSFRLAMVNLRSGNYEDARTKLQLFVDTNPSTAVTDDAIFWIGIALKQQKQCDRAVLLFSDVFQKFPAEDMTPPSLYFLAVCFSELGSKNDAILTLQKLQDEHPRSAYAGKGRALLSELRPGKKKG